MRERERERGEEREREREREREMRESMCEKERCGKKGKRVPPHIPVYPHIH